MDNKCPECGKGMQYDIQLEYDHSPYYCIHCGYAEGCYTGFEDKRCSKCTEYAHCKRWDNIKNGDNNKNIPMCSSCGKKCTEINEYIEIAKIESVEIDEYVKCNEGTYNRKNNTFICTSCYVKTLIP